MTVLPSCSQLIKIRSSRKIVGCCVFLRNWTANSKKFLAGTGIDNLILRRLSAVKEVFLCMPYLQRMLRLRASSVTQAVN